MLDDNPVRWQFNRRSGRLIGEDRHQTVAGLSNTQQPMIMGHLDTSFIKFLLPDRTLRVGQLRRDFAVDTDKMRFGTRSRNPLCALQRRVVPRTIVDKNLFTCRTARGQKILGTGCMFDAFQPVYIRHTASRHDDDLRVSR